MWDGSVFDMIVIGGGPGGYTAALYAARAGLRVLVLEKLWAGGQMALAHWIENYPGFPQGIDGHSLGSSMKAQAERFGAVTGFAQVTKVCLSENPKTVEAGGQLYYGKTLVLATGARPRQLGLPGERELLGRGIAYCAECDAMFYRGKTVAVVGGGNTAVSDAALLSNVAAKVYLIHRKPALRADRIDEEALKRAANVTILWNSAVTALFAGEQLTGVQVTELPSGSRFTLECDGLFISIGRVPETELFANQLELTPGGYIPAGEATETAIPGVYAVGDVRAKPLCQIVTAMADGAVAAHRAQEYLAQ